MPPSSLVADTIRHHGTRWLDNVHLLALLLGRGACSDRSMQAASAILAAVDRDITQLGRYTMSELSAIPGIGCCTAHNLLAAVELGLRITASTPPERTRVHTSQTAYDLLRPKLAYLHHEEFWLILLDRGLRVMDLRRVSSGGLHGTVADPKLIFHAAISERASCLVLAHNHPSGQLRPSEEDIRLTRKLTEGGRLLDIVVNDHLILTDTGYYSFADNGQLR